MRRQATRLRAAVTCTAREWLLLPPRLALVALWVVQRVAWVPAGTANGLLWLVSGQWLEEKEAPRVKRRDHHGHLIIEDTKYYRITKG